MQPKFYFSCSCNSHDGMIVNSGSFVSGFWLIFIVTIRLLRHIWSTNKTKSMHYSSHRIESWMNHGQQWKCSRKIAQIIFFVLIWFSLINSARKKKRLCHVSANVICRRSTRPNPNYFESIFERTNRTEKWMVQISWWDRQRRIEREKREYGKFHSSLKDNRIVS